MATLPLQTSRTHPGSSRWAPLGAACIGTFLLLVYTTIVTAALPDIASSSLQANFTQLQWIVDAFTVALAGLLLACGSLSDALGSKRIYLIGLTVFSLATLSCGLSVDTEMLIGSRLVQGIAGAAMFATILPLVATSYQGEDRPKALAVWGAVSGVASAVGTFAGGLIVQVAGWRWIFLVSLPICVIALVMGRRYLPTGDRKSVPLDYPGMTAFTVAIAALCYATISAGEGGVTSPATVAALVVTLVSGVIFAVIERRTPHPLVPPKLFVQPRLTGVVVIAFGYYFATFGALPVLSLWLQDAIGFNSLQTSTVLAVQVVVFVIASSTVSARLHRHPPAYTLGGGTLLIAGGCITALLVAIHADWVALVPALVITGVGAGVVSPIFPAVAMSSVPSEFAGTASAAANSARQLGLAIGVALCAGLYGAHHEQTLGAAHAIAEVMVLCTAVALTCGVGGALLLLRPPHEAVAGQKENR